jgi:hypothetical protein
VKHHVVTASGGLAVAIALLAPTNASAADCTSNPTPACHLAEGNKLVKSNPKQAAVEFLASYKLDERTDTLELYAVALEADKQYALAAETWERIVKYREGELTAAKEQKKNIAAAQRKMTGAAKAVTKLEANTAKVRIKLNPGPPPKVTRDGNEVDPNKEIWVKAGSDELVFTFADGSSSAVPVQLKAGENVRIDAPKAKPVEPPKPPDEPKPPIDPKQPEVKQDPEPPVVGMKDPEVKPLPPGPAEPHSNFKRNLGLGMIGGGVILAGVATTFAIVASNKFSDAKDAGCDDDANCPAGRATNLAEQSNDNARVAQITGIGAVALIGTGVTLWLLHKKESNKSSMTINVSGKSAALGWRF